MSKLKAYKYRLYPTKKQRNQARVPAHPLSGFAGCVAPARQGIQGVLSACERRKNAGLSEMRKATGAMRVSPFPNPVSA